MNHSKFCNMKYPIHLVTMVTVWLVLLVLAGFPASIQCASSDSPPNIIFILADDYGFHDIGYHASNIKTPWLDKLAAGGVKLENYYVQPICTPTRSQLMSGRYQIHTGLEHSIIWVVQPSCLPLENPTLADRLKDLGYATHAVGKWHLGFYKKACWPTQRGFDTFFGYYTGSEDYYSHMRGCFMPGDDSSCAGFCPGYDLRDQEAPAYQDKGQYSTFLFAERAQRILESHDPKKPFFMYLPFQAVHSPLQVPEKYLEPYKDIKDKKRQVYSGMVTCMDEAIGNITQRLVQLGLWNNTVLIFSTDNGGQIAQGGNNWPLRGWKASLWEGGVHGVGFVHSPLIPKVKQGTVSTDLIHVSDWFPTIVAGIANGSVAGLSLDGFNVWDSISKGAPSPRKEILHNIDVLMPDKDALKNLSTAQYSDPPYLRRFNESGAFNTSIRAAIRMGDWKLITGFPGNSSWIPPPETSIVPIHPVEPVGKHVWLFNIQEDPNERNDLSDTQPDIVEGMIARLQYYYSTMVPPFYPPGDPKANPKLHGGIWTNWE